MKNTLLSFLFLGFILNAQQQEIPKGILAPNQHHTGKAWLNFMGQANDLFNHNVVLATFEAGAKLDWHSHKQGQQLIVLSGHGHYQEKGKPIQPMRPGVVINCSPNTLHWHSSTKNTAVSYLAIYSPSPTQWDAPLTQSEYDVSLLRTLFDDFAVLADKKQVKAQMKLFTPNAVVESYREGKRNSVYNGHDEIEKAFADFLSQFDSVEHKNGEHRVEVNGSNAKGYGSCKVTLANKETRLEWTVNYIDTYIFEDNKWLIQKRESYFN